MDMSALAQMMLEWERVKRRLDEIEAAIKDSVLQIGKTQTVGNVRATYSGGRKSYDYEAAILSVPDLSADDLIPFRISKIDYRAACKELEIVDIPFAQSPPSVSVKLLE